MGRGFTEHDRSGADPVAVIDDTLAQYWPGENALCKRIRAGGVQWATIVGIGDNAVLASYVPAHRATHVDPVVV